MFDKDSTLILIHLRKPVNVHGEVKDDNGKLKEGKSSKKPCVSPFDLSYSSTASPACQLLNYWNVLQVIQLRGEHSEVDFVSLNDEEVKDDEEMSPFERFLKKLRDEGLIQNYRFKDHNQVANDAEKKFTKTIQ